MKKVLLVAMVVGLGFTSCSKGDYNCTCTTEIFGVSSTSVTAFESVKEDDAKEACDAGTSTGISTCVLTDA